MHHKKKQITVLFIPDDNGKTVSITIPRAIIRTLVVFIVLFIGGMAVLLFLAGDIAVKLQLVQSLVKENRRLQADNLRLQQVAQKIDTMQKTYDYLARLVLQTSGITTSSATQAVTDSMHDSGGSDDAGANEGLSPLSRNRPMSAEELLEALPYLRPVEGWITRVYTSDSAGTNRGHPGVDFAAAQGTLIRATSPGIVAAVGSDSYFGKMVTVEHKYGFVTRYGHCSQILVAPGDHVKRGQTIALVGSTGRSSAPHLHYEVLSNGRTVDPLRYILTRQE